MKLLKLDGEVNLWYLRSFIKLLNEASDTLCITVSYFSDIHKESL